MPNSRIGKLLAAVLAAPVAAMFIGAALVVGAVAPASAQEFDINKVFWCDAGKKTGEQTEAECTEARGAILSNCTSCHAITPIVKAQKAKPGWTAFMQNHQSKVPDIAPDVYVKMTTFLAGHYNPKNKPPQLPPELDALGVPPA